MKYEIVPSLLSVRKQTQKYLDMLKGRVSTVQIDVMDGIFVDEKAFSVDEVVSLETGLHIQYDLMTVVPERRIVEYALASAGTIIFHIEAAKDPAALIKLIKEEACRVGISISPRTPAEKIKPFLKDVDLVLVMTVEPGKGGQEYIPETLEKVKQIRKWDKKVNIEVDGGIKLDNIQEAKKAGANMFVVGTGIFSAQDPMKALDNFKKLIK